MNRTFWCNVHQRLATPEMKCDVRLGGVMLPCVVVELTGIAEIRRSRAKCYPPFGLTARALNFLDNANLILSSGLIDRSKLRQMLNNKDDLKYRNVGEDTHEELWEWLRVNGGMPLDEMAYRNSKFQSEC